MAFRRGFITLYSVVGWEGFSHGDMRVWICNSINNDQRLLGQRWFDSGSSVINPHIAFQVDECDLYMGCLYLVMEIVTQASFDRVDIGLARIPLQELIRPGWFMPISCRVQNTFQEARICVVNACVYTELAYGLGNYVHPPPVPHTVVYPVAPQQYQYTSIFSNIATHFLVDIFSEIGSQAIYGQDIFGDGFNIADLFASGPM